MNQNSDESLSNLLAALAEIQTDAPVEFEYRVYYDEKTKNCTHKTICDEPGTFIQVTREEYDAVDFCPHYFINADNKIEKKKLDFSERTKLKLSGVGFKTLKGNNIFKVSATYEGPADFWELKDQ